MPGPDPFLGFIEDSFWTRYELVPRLVDQVPTNHHSHHRLSIDELEEWPVELLDLKYTRHGLCKLCFKDNDGFRSEKKGIRLRIARTINVLEEYPLMVRALRSLMPFFSLLNPSL